MRDATFTASPRDVEEEFARADDASHNRTAGDANADRYTASVRIVQVRRGITYFERQLRQRRRVVGPRRRYATDHHVAVARGLDLFELVPIDQPIEIREHAIEELHQVVGGGIARPRREARHVGEHNRSLVVFVRDHGLRPALEPASDGSGQDIREQDVGSLALTLRSRFGARGFAQGVEYDREEHRAAYNSDGNKVAELRCRGLQPGIVGHEDLRGDDERRSNDAKRRGEKDMLNTEEQDDERRGHQVVELHARAGAKQDNDEEEIHIADDEQDERCRQRAEAVEQRNRRADQCGERVDSGHPPQTRRRIEELDGGEAARDGRDDPCRDVEPAKPPCHFLGIALSAVADDRNQAQLLPPS